MAMSAARPLLTGCSALLLWGTLGCAVGKSSRPTPVSPVPVSAPLAVPASPRPATRTAQPAVDSVPAHDSFTVHSRPLGEPRLINVYTPLQYRAAVGGSATPLPVLYMPDGGIDEDFPHVVHTVDSLIVAARSDRSSSSACPTRNDDAILPVPLGSRPTAPSRRVSEGGLRSAEFLRDEFVPEVDRRYRTTRERGIIGESLAGLFVVETFLDEPSLFTHYIALDASVWWNCGCPRRFGVHTDRGVRCERSDAVYRHVR